MLFQRLTLLLSKDIMGKILDLTFCISIHPTVLKAIMCILCVAVGMGSHLVTGPFHTPTVLSLIPYPPRQGLHSRPPPLLGSIENGIKGRRAGCKQVETVSVMAISIPLGQAQQRMENGATGGQGGESWLGSRRQKRPELLVKGTANNSRKTSYNTKQSSSRGEW